MLLRVERGSRRLARVGVEVVRVGVGVPADHRGGDELSFTRPPLVHDRQ